MQDLSLKGSPTRIRSTSNGVLLLLGVFNVILYVKFVPLPLPLLKAFPAPLPFSPPSCKFMGANPNLGPRLKCLACFNCGATYQLITFYSEPADRETSELPVSQSLSVLSGCTWSWSRQCFCNASHVRLVRTVSLHSGSSRPT